MKLVANLDFNRLQSLNRVIQNLATPPTPVAGLEYYDTTYNSSFEYNGTAWIPRNATLLAAGTLPITVLSINPLNRANHTGTQLSSTISDLAVTVKGYTLDSFAAPVANVAMNGYTLTGLNTSPNAPGQAAEYSWVMGQIQSSAAGIDSKPSVVAVSVTNISTIAGLLVVDGYQTVAGDRILLTAQTNAALNGPYIVSSGAWTRASDTITPQAFWFVEQGTSYAGSQWKVSTSGTITVGTTSITINQFGSTINYTAGNGLSLAGTVFNISLITNSGLVASGSGLGVLLQSNSGLALGSTGLAVQLPSGSGLKTDSTGLSIDKTQVPTKFVQTIGDGTATTFTITHNLNTQDIIIQVKDTATYSTVLADTAAPTVNTATITFAVAPASNSYRVVIIG